MRTLLFVQTGESRPKCLGDVAVAAGAQAVIEGDGSGYVWTSKQAEAMADADSWWIVECKDARSGLWMIAPEWCNGRTSWPPPTGRILAEGGKEMRA